MKQIIGVGIKEMIEIVQKRKLLKIRNGKQFLCNYPKYDKDRQPMEVKK